MLESDVFFSETKRFPFFSILFPQFLKRMTDHYLKTFFLLSLKRIHLKKPPSFSDSEADLFCCYFSFWGWCDWGFGYLFETNGAQRRGKRNWENGQLFFAICCDRNAHIALSYSHNVSVQMMLIGTVGWLLLIFPQGRISFPSPKRRLLWCPRCLSWPS